MTALASPVQVSPTDVRSISAVLGGPILPSPINRGSTAQRGQETCTGCSTEDGD